MLPRHFKALRHRDFRLFWAGLIVSLIGSTLHSTAMSWLVWRLTQSPAMLGLVGFAGNAPVILFGFFAGAVVDRHDRRRLLLAAQTGMMLLAFLTAHLTWTGAIRVEHVLVISLLMGAIGVIEVPARQTMLMDLVGSDDLMSAIALNSSAFNVARIVGPSAAGVAIATFTEAGCFLANGLSFLAILLALLSITVRVNPVPAAHQGGPLDGLRYILRRPDMRVLLAMVAIMNLFGGGHHQVLPVYVSNVAHGDERTLGFFTSCYGIGALLGGLLIAGRERTSLDPRLAARGAALFATALLALSYGPGNAASAFLLVVMGLATITQFATTNNYLQTRAPDGLRGRIIAAYTTTLLGCFPIGSLLMGWTAEHFGVQFAMAAGAAACLALVLPLYPRLPRSAVPA